jgi:hypothetical protein
MAADGTPLQPTKKGIAMKLTTLSLVAGGLLALTTAPWTPECHAQVTVTQTTTTEPVIGTFSEFAPGSETLVIKSETAPAPIRYSVTKQTTYVDEGGAPVVVEKIAPGTPISVRYVREGDRLIASRVIVRHAPAAPVVERHKTTTTTTTRKLTDDEKDRLEDIRENQKERREELREREEDRRDHDDD